MLRTWILGCSVLLVGCGAQSAREAGTVASDRTVNTNDAQIVTGGAVSKNSDDAAVAGIDRKIIYEAAITLFVSDFDDLEAQVPRLVKDHGGYLADVSIDRTLGEHRSGHWLARIPVAQFDSFLDAVSTLGVPENRSQTAQDVTEEYVDLDARIANSERLEKRILELLDNSAGKIKDVIEVERELARVRGDIEQMEGRLRFLTNRTELTTVRIDALEQRDYVPPEAPTFLARMEQAWGNSVYSLRNFGEDVAVGVAYVFPWIVVLAVFVLPMLWYARRRLVSSRQ